MSGGWFVSRGSTRTDALAAEVERLAALVEALAARCDRIADERRADAALLDELRQRLAASAEEAHDHRIAAGRQAEEVTDSVERLRLRLAALETQRVWDGEEMQRIADGLLQQIARLRRPGGDGAS